ncbi:MAG: MCE family protein [Candidatus Sericytochromatia bacterium]|nr:MCE family protein [Candidatus Sericytochromatia bacterium]
MKHWKEFSLGLFILTAAVLLAYMSITIGKVQFGETLQVQAIFRNASGIVKDAPVMMAGIEVGHVKKMEVKDGQALMTLVLQPNVSVYRDARAEIRAKSLLGEKYIALLPGSTSEPPLQNGAQISDTMTPVDLDEVLNHLSPVLTQLDPKDLNTLIHSLAVAVDGRGKEIGDLIAGGAVLMEVIGENKAALARSIQNLDATAAQANSLLARNRPALDRIVQNADVVVAELRRDAPGLLAGLRTTTDDVREITAPFKTKAPELASNLDKIARDTAGLTSSLKKHPNLVTNLDNTLIELPPLLKKAPATLDRLPGVLDQLSPVLSGASTLVEKLDPLVDKANEVLQDGSLDEIVNEKGVKVQIEQGIQVRLW